MNESTLLTSEPIAPVPVDMEPVRARLSGSNREKFEQIVHTIDSQFTPEFLPDEQIMGVVAESCQFYADLFRNDTARAFRYLGVGHGDAEPLPAGEASTPDAKEENPYKRRPKPSSAFGQFYESIGAEFRAVGASEEEIHKNTQRLIDEYDGFSQDLAEDLAEKLDRFELVVGAFGAPDVLRAEAQDGALAYLEQLCTRIEKLGERPEKENIAGRIGAVLNGRKTLSQDEFDRYVTSILNGFKIRQPKELLEGYIKSAMLFYAKAIYGRRYFSGSMGFDSDPAYLYDSFEASRTDGNLNRPELPRDIVQEAVRAKIETMIFGDNEWGEAFRTRSGRNEWQESERRSRERIFGSRNYSQHSTAQHKTEAIKRNDPIEQRIIELDPIKQQAMMDLSRLIGSIPDKTMKQNARLISKLKIDFIERLEKSEAKYTDFKRLIRRAMTELHPDRKPEADDAEELCKFYSVLFEHLDRA